mmetsp:Transcript_2742/g.3701  ORF Transcript_2742/g.3701 Transcript_2742/m.3701 type:complete len:256 (-) Transcript_2742:70-837(-)
MVSPQELIYKGAMSMTSSKFAEAEALFGEARLQLAAEAEAEAELEPQPKRRKPQHADLVSSMAAMPPASSCSSLRFVPVMDRRILHMIGFKASECEMFQHPIAAVSNTSNNQDHPATVCSVDALLAVCLFNLGLCYQLDGSSICNEVACECYESAWACIRRYNAATTSTTVATSGSDTSNNDDSSLLLEMAICLNMAACKSQLGQVSVANHWTSCLRLLLEFSQPKRGDKYGMSFRRFFVLATVLGGSLAAAAAA